MATSDHSASDWRDTLDDLEARREASRKMGGEERLAKHRANGKLDARARIEYLLDDGSFHELGTLVGGADLPADGVVIGSGKIDGRPVMVGAEDFTVKAGTIGQASNAKRWRIAELAADDRVPLVMILEGAGHRADGEKRVRAPVDLIAQPRGSGRVPVLTAVLGPSAGHGALIAPMSDFAVMSKGACIFTAGPPVVFESLGQTISKEELGGPAVATASGLIHNVGKDDAETLDLLRAYLSYFPSSAWSYPPEAPADHAASHREPRLVPEILDVIPRNGRKQYDVRGVLDVVFDESSCFEIQRKFGKAIVTSLARLGGHPVAVIANQPRVNAGSIDSDAAEKAARFISVADAFHLPLIFLADNPGVMPGKVSEQNGILRSGARMFAAQSLATVPKFEVTLRKAYGFGSMVMSMIGFDGQSGVFGFPGSTLGVMGAGAMSRSKGADSEEAQRLARAELDASYGAAESMGFDELIDPREIRNQLLHGLERALFRRQAAAEPAARIGILP